MNYIIPVAIVLLCYKSVLGSEELTDNELSDTTNDESLHRVRRAGLSMLRLGRGLQMLRLGKRALPMLRLGRSTGDELSNDYIQYIMSLIRGDRQVPLPRYGKDLALNEMLMEALKNAEMRNTEMPDIDSFGYALDYSPERQIRPAPRPGMRYRRSADASDADMKLSDADSSYDQEPDRKLNVRIAPLMRYGKELNPEDYDIDEGIVKRAMRMLRLGRGMRMLRLGKRPMDSEDVTEEEKRALNLLRLGKRPFRMLRLGRSDNEEEKRAPLHLLRLGKKSDS